MSRPRKPPSYLVDATVYRSAKLAALPSDTARLGFFYVVLGQAKLSTPPGQFASKGHFREVAGRFSRYLDDYLRAGILELAPKLCDRCRARHRPSRAGALVVHDWHEHQYDPGALERQRAWEAAHPDRHSDTVSDAVSDAVSGAQSDAVSDAVSDPLSDGYLARDRAPDRVANVERRTRTKNDERISSEEDRSSLVPDRPDVALLLERWGWRGVSNGQLAILDEIADRHDRPKRGEAWGQYAAAVMAEAADGEDPIAHLRAVDNAWQAERRAELDAEEARLAAEKAERAKPSKSFAELLGSTAVRTVPEVLG